MAVGSFCLVLHGHLPYVLRHGRWPHGEDWLYEAAAETYLPLLAVLSECAFLNGNPRMTIGLTPVLLEQLAHDDFKNGFARYLEDRIDRARSDRAEFDSTGEKHFAYLAGRWETFYGELTQQFDHIDRDIPRAFVQQAEAGHVELLTSPAAHPYLPLLLEDSSLVGQFRAGLNSSERILGFRPKGVWLPEGAYRGNGFWKPPINWGGARDRRGLECLVQEMGLDHFFVENELIERSRSEWLHNDHWRKVGWDHAVSDAQRGWASVLEPVRVNSSGQSADGPVAFGRDPWICKQVWSGKIGYPADGAYLEFHKKHGERRGLRYWKVTDPKAGLGEKDPYYPEDVEARVHVHARHFCDEIKKRLWDHQHRTGRHGVVAGCFDAELFGHWWFEGPRFLREVLLTLNAEPDVDVCTSAEFLERHPPDKTVALPEGSWGEGGDHRVWANDKTAWMWEVEYRCEMLFGKLTYHLPWRERPQLRQLLERAGRELLLLQASDWPFVIAREQAVDYGIKRFMQHVSRFECLTDIAERIAENGDYLGRLSEVERFELEDADVHDVIFPTIDLEWWST